MPSVTISSAGTGGSIITDWIGAKTTSVTATFSTSTSSAAFKLEGTLDSSALGFSPMWFALSTTTFTSSTHFDSPPFVQVQSPLAGVRLNSTGLSAGTITMDVLQNAGG
jgi:hypothetical protein